MDLVFQRATLREKGRRVCSAGGTNTGLNDFDAMYQMCPETEPYEVHAFMTSPKSSPAAKPKAQPRLQLGHMQEATVNPASSSGYQAGSSDQTSMRSTASSSGTSNRNPVIWNSNLHLELVKRDIDDRKANTKSASKTHD